MIKEKNKKIRVLHVLNSFSVNGGGAETFVMNVYRTIDKRKFSIDFLVRSDKNNNQYIEEVTSNGDSFFVTPSFPKHLFSNFRETKKIIISGQYDVIHIHANALIYIYPIIVANKANIPIRIIHSHNTTSPSGLLGKLIHSVNKLYIHKFVTHSIACGEDAGTWMFGKRKFTVINNSININKFLYNKQTREKIRAKYNIDDKFVIGHVGRFTEQKNHEYLIEIFNEYFKENKKAVLLLVGSGELIEKVKNKVKEKKLTDYVIFVGAQSNVNEFLSAMDVFVFPSIYEGLPFVLVEAQASGLCAVVSEEITKEVDIIGNMRYISLKDDKKKWIESIEQIRNNHINRTIDYEIMNKYDMKYNINVLENIYKGL